MEAKGRAGSTWKEGEAKNPKSLLLGRQGGEREKGGEEARTLQVEKFEHFPHLFHFSAVVTGSSPAAAAAAAAAAGAGGRSAATRHFLGLRWAPFPSFAPFCFEEKEEKGREEIQAPKPASIVSGEMVKKEKKKKKAQEAENVPDFCKSPLPVSFLLLLLLSPVCRCEQEEKGEKCEDERRWNNEFIAECHPAMAISTIRHCRLPLKGRASKPPLPHFLLI
ncbi:uncharacterized protein LOC128144791 isoform X2 [Harpia harpyja]|uniref:uncharacterized protein LOC128144791 isoform X2 n=1 Tax=Harpia harpyja TaxID=202280 RepID=UPI0022B2078E|nr:uncharacterized protein LOC128144791 isoform X2 [Harpia harpyja]